MTTLHHTAIATGESNAPSTINTRLSGLDSAIGNLGNYPSAASWINSLTLADSAVVATIFEDTSTVNVLVTPAGSGLNFKVGARVWYLVGGVLEYNTVAASASTVVELTTAPSGTISANTLIGQLSESNYQASTASVNFGNSTSSTLATAVKWASGGIYNVLAYGADPTGSTDCAAAIQAADNAAKANNGGIVVFPEGSYLIGSKITKSALTMWQGAGAGELNNNVNGTIIRANGAALNSDTMIEIEGDGVSIWAMQAGMTNIAIHGTRGGGGVLTPSNCTGVRIGSSVRQQYFHNVNMLYLTNGFVMAGGGEFHFAHCFISGVKFAWFASNGVADCYWVNCFGGSGLTNGIATADLTGGAGWFIRKATNLQFTNCRFQVQREGTGGTFVSCDAMRFVAPIADANESNGLTFVNCTNVEITSIDSYENGTTSSNAAGLLLQSTGATVTASNSGGDLLLTHPSSFFVRNRQVIEFSNSGGALPTGLSADTKYYAIFVSATTIKIATSFVNAGAGTAIAYTDAGTGTHTLRGVSEDINVIGGMIYDRNMGNANEKQAFGINYSVSNGEMRHVLVSGVNLTRISTPINNQSQVTGKTVYRDCDGLSGVLYTTSTDTAFNVETYGPYTYVLAYAGSIGSDRNYTLPSEGIYDGLTFRFVRLAATTGSGNVVVKKADGTTTVTGSTLSAPTTVAFCDVTYSETLADWFVSAKSTI